MLDQAAWSSIGDSSVLDGSDSFKPSCMWAFSSWSWWGRFGGGSWRCCRSLSTGFLASRSKRALIIVWE
jgi:hypothetical protein